PFRELARLLKFTAAVEHESGKGQRRHQGKGMPDGLGQRNALFDLTSCPIKIPGEATAPGGKTERNDGRVQAHSKTERVMNSGIEKLQDLSGMILGLGMLTTVQRKLPELAMELDCQSQIWLPIEQAAILLCQLFHRPAVSSCYVDTSEPNQDRNLKRG